MIEKLEKERDEIKRQVQPLLARLEQLNREIDAALSREFIQRHGITAHDVQPSRGDGVPWIGTLPAFAQWLRDTQCCKPYCEWNGQLYPVLLVINGRYEPTCARFKDVPKEQPE